MQERIKAMSTYITRKKSDIVFLLVKSTKTVYELLLQKQNRVEYKYNHQYRI